MRARRPPTSTENWTPRQREVLDLLAQGRSNAEIAEHLGVSLDGAKWHVREIMGRLGVESREDAADYWRKENGLPARLRRRVVVIPMLRLGWPAAAIPVGLLLVVAVAVGTIVALRGNDPPRTGPGAETPRATAHATPSPAATTSTNPPTETPLPLNPRFGPGNGQDILATIDGEPIYELKVSPSPVSLPVDSLLYYSYCPVPCLGDTLAGAFIDASGDVTESARMPLAPVTAPGSTFGTFVGDGNSGFAVLWCAEAAGRCGKRHDGTTDDVPRTVLVSHDGGISWSQAGNEVDALTSLAGFVDGQLILAKRIVGAGLTFEYVSAVTGLSVPAPGGPDIVTESGTLVTVGYQEVTPESPWAIVEVTAPGQGNPSYLGFPLGNLSLHVALSDTLILGTAMRSEKATDPRTSDSYGELRHAMVVIDLAQKTVSYISGFQPAQEYVESRTPLQFLEGPFVRVATDPCLNVRLRPDVTSSSLGCFAPGVILQVRTEEPAVEAWTAVSTPDGRPGWVASEYVEPLSADSD